MTHSRRRRLGGRDLCHRMVVIPGAQKSGTSSLFQMLGTLEECCLSEPKEPQFFALEANVIEQNFEWYRSRFEGCQRGQYLVDASTSYLSCEGTAELLFQAFPRAKIIVILRDPVDRLWSSVIHMRKRVPEPDQRTPGEVIEELPIHAETAVEVVLAEDELLRQAICNGRIDPAYMDGEYLWRRFGARFDSHFRDPHWPFRYVKQSLYSLLVDPYEQLFGSNLKVVFFEELVRGSERARDEILALLGIQADKWPQPWHANRTWFPRGKWARSTVATLEQFRRIAGFKYGRPLTTMPPVPLRPVLFGPKPEPTPTWRQRARRLLDQEYNYWVSRYPRLATLWGTDVRP